MTTRTHTPLLSLSIATYLAGLSCLAQSLPPFLPASGPELAEELMTSLPVACLSADRADRSHARGRCCHSCTWRIGVDISHETCYHLTYMDTQLSRFSVVNDHPILAAHPPYHRYGFERTDRTNRMHPTALRACTSAATRAFRWSCSEGVLPHPRGR